MERNNSIDFLKGISLYLVVVNHLANQMIGTNIFTQVISLVHLPMLFVASGYLFNSSWKNRSLNRIILGKVRHLLLPYISWSVIALIVSMITNHNIRFEFVKDEFIQIFIYGRSVWFLLTLFLVTVLCSIFFKLFIKIPYLLRIIVFFIGYIFLCYVLPNEIFQLIKMKVYILYFILGLFLNEYKEINEKIYSKVRKNIYVLIALFIVGCFLFLHSEQANYMVDFVIKEEGKYMIVVAYVLTIIGMNLLVYICNLKISNNIRNVFQRMGVCSLDIYVIHMFFVRVIGVLMLKVVSVEIVRNILMFVSGFAIAYTIVVLKERLLKKIKIYRWINGGC